MCGILRCALAVPVVGGTSVPTREYLRGASVRRSPRRPSSRSTLAVPCALLARLRRGHRACACRIGNGRGEPRRLHATVGACGQGHVHLISLACTCGLCSHASTGRRAQLSPACHLRGSYSGNDTTVGAAKAVILRSMGRPWRGSTDRRDRGRHSRRNAWHSPTQPRRCVRTCSASARLVRRSTPHHRFSPRIRGLRGVSGRLLSPHSGWMQSVLWESTVVQPRQAKPKAG